MRWQLIVVTAVAAVLGFVIAFAASGHVSEEDRVQQNYLRNFLVDLRNTSDENASLRRYECVDSAHKAKRFLDAGAKGDAVNEYLRLCASVQ